MTTTALVIALVDLALFCILIVFVAAHHKVLKGLSELKKELEKIAEELKAQKITEQINNLKNKVAGNARRFYAHRVILFRIFEAMERFAKASKDLAQKERPEEISESEEQKGGEENEQRKT